MFSFGKKNIFKVIKNGTLDDLKQYIAEHPEELESTEGPDSATPLNYAARRNNVEAIQYLIKCGAELDTQDNDGYSALYNAIYFKHPEATQVLLDAGASTELITFNSRRTARNLYTTAKIRNMVKKHLDAQKATAQILPETVTGKFIKENDYIVSYTDYAEATATSITTYFNFDDQTITRKTKDKDGVSNFMQSFAQAANKQKLKDAAAFLQENDGKVGDLKLPLIS